MLTNYKVGGKILKMTELRCPIESGEGRLTSLILKKAMPVSKESEPAWC